MPPWVVGGSQYHPWETQDFSDPHFPRIDTSSSIWERPETSRSFGVLSVLEESLPTDINKVGASSSQIWPCAWHRKLKVLSWPKRGQAIPLQAAPKRSKFNISVPNRQLPAQPYCFLCGHAVQKGSMQAAARITSAGGFQRLTQKVPVNQAVTSQHSCIFIRFEVFGWNLTLKTWCKLLSVLLLWKSQSSWVFQLTAMVGQPTFELWPPWNYTTLGKTWWLLWSNSSSKNILAIAPMKPLSIALQKKSTEPRLMIDFSLETLM